MKIDRQGVWLDSIPVAVGYFIGDSEGCRAVHVNENLARLFGLTGDELCHAFSSSLIDIFHEDDVPKIERLLYKARITGGSYRELVRIRRSTGAYHYDYLWLNSLPQEDGSRLFCIVFSDANSQMETRERLDMAYENLLRIMDNAPGGIVVLDTVNGENPTPVYLSHGLCNLLEGERDEIERVYLTNLYSYVHPDDREEVVQTFERAVRNPSEFTMKLRLLTLKGNYVWVLASGAVEISENHRSVYLSLVDASREQEIQHTLTRVLDSFARHQFERIYLLDTEDGTFRSLSTAGGELSVVTPESGEDFDGAIDILIDRYVIEDERDRLKARMKVAQLVEALRDRNDVEYLFRLCAADGIVRYKAVWVSWIDRNEGTLSLIASDRTAEHEHEEESRAILRDTLAAAEQANIAKSDFLSRMSHDIRTPLNAIIGFTEMGLDDIDISDAERERLTKIDTSSRFLLSLINDILDMSRIESGKLALDERPFDLDAFVAGISAIIAPQCKARGIRYECRVAERAQGPYVGDDLKLQRIFLNLLGNSVKFTQKDGQIIFSIDAGCEVQGRRTLICRVVDTGCGIDKAFMPHLFETFTQETRDRFNLGKGSGLGLAICKNLASMMNGTIEVDSEVGKGSTFTVELPLTVGNAAEDMAEASTIEKRAMGARHCAYDFGGKRVLVAEDNAMNMEIACYLLAKVNLAVDGAENGRQALECFEASPEGTYAAFLTDIIMPEMNGLETAAAIRALDRDDAKNVPIIAMSANAFEEDERESVRFGIDAYVVKPIDPETLYRTLESTLK